MHRRTGARQRLGRAGACARPDPSAPRPRGEPGVCRRCGAVWPGWRRSCPGCGVYSQPKNRHLVPTARLELGQLESLEALKAGAARRQADARLKADVKSEADRHARGASLAAKAAHRTVTTFSPRILDCHTKYDFPLAFSVTFSSPEIFRSSPGIFRTPPVCLKRGSEHLMSTVHILTS